MLFNPATWDDQVEETGRQAIGRIYVENAIAELKIHKQSPTKAVGEPDQIVPFKIPPWMLNAVRVELDETFEQSYWADISKTTGDDLIRLLLAGVEDGMSIRQIADSIIRDMGPRYSRFRATNISRTEVTHAANGGHVLAMRKLEETGLVTGKRWSSVLGNTTRQSHRGLHDVTTEGVDGNFILNGVATPWPGHHRLRPKQLPVSQRVRVRSNRRVGRLGLRS